MESMDQHEESLNESCEMESASVHMQVRCFRILASTSWHAVSAKVRT